MIDHRSYTHNLSSCEIKAWKKNSGLNGIRTHDLCNTDAMLYQQANWELVTLRVRAVPVEGEECKWIYERSWDEDKQPDSQNGWKWA